MTDTRSTPTTELPSSRRLLQSTLVAAAVAAVVLVTAVLPGEYGLDPTGVGRLLGLTQMGEVKVALAKEVRLADSVAAAAAQGAASEPSAVPASAPVPATAGASTARAPTVTAPANSHVTEIVLRPNEGREVKLTMRKDARVAYSWSAEGGVVNYDTHADAPGIRYHAYEKGTARQEDEGVLAAAFDGAHGWFWRNRGRDVVTVTLRTKGEYQELKRVK